MPWQTTGQPDRTLRPLQSWRERHPWEVRHQLQQCPYKRDIHWRRLVCELHPLEAKVGWHGQWLEWTLLSLKWLYSAFRDLRVRDTNHWRVRPDEGVIAKQSNKNGSDCLNPRHQAELSYESGLRLAFELRTSCRKNWKKWKRADYRKYAC